MLTCPAPPRFISANTLIGTLNRLRKFAEAIELSTKTLSGYHKVLGPDHPATLGSQMNLAALLGNTGSHNKSAALHQATLTSQTRVLGAQNPNALNTAVMLSVALTHLCAHGTLMHPLHLRLRRRWQWRRGGEEVSAVARARSFATS